MSVLRLKLNSIFAGMIFMMMLCFLMSENIYASSLDNPIFISDANYNDAAAELKRQILSILF